MDPLTEFRQVEQYITRFEKALRECVPYATYEERQTQDQGQGTEPEGDQETQVQVEIRPVSEDLTWCRVSEVFEDDEAITIPRPPSSLRLLEYRCGFDGLRMAEVLAQRRSELWRMLKDQQRQREQREFHESMLRFKLEQKKERALEVTRLEHRLKSQ
ncbi:hypothetical protein BGZ52_002743 [Haplosporangium bisporale]|nr:hypothetical protein BGZ52_002743 [Haplosporangium bisporale]KFH70694.1 hypothetical protein MVEG_03542 [Podila verticillata NRRL 6337]